ncbi:HEAT repeat domain-containing protein [filamentous cyanobacterium LEGE 11480]|uniref:HEAT repeat domain-containing protein n=1 Tax=Romeriopsis navalis LEGE 11480 TaxID=2777977 RepID=A0A928VJK4_9CYAN|nr:HEAT repeat domain-containing protein [Romeriopsis navalis]MBE9029781.1 HEAT repeat domain-containing protein [Romeriopsis navalis LEGE 11480]
MTEVPEQGEQLTVEQAIENLIGDDLGLRFYSAWWLGRFKVTDIRAVDRLIAALDDEDDRTEDGGGYPFRRNAARALGKLGNEKAVPKLIEALDCTDFYVREAAAQSLEMLGAVSAIPKLTEQLQRGLAPAEQPAAQLVDEQPDLSEPYDAYLEALGTLGAVAVIPLIEPFLGHPVPRTQYAADRAMYQLTGDAKYGNLLIEALQGDDLQLRRAALTDVGAIGYLPAAEAIFETLAENSLKLISLKGVLERQLKAGEPLSDGAIRVMDLMDGLL